MIDTARLAQEVQALVAHPTSNLTAASLLLAIVVIAVLVILIVALLLLTSGTARSKRQHRPPPGPDSAPESQSALGRRVTILAIVLIAALSVAATYVYTGRSEYCTSSCHAMTPAADSWESSSHSTVACVSCHESSIAGGISSRVRHLVTKTTGSTLGEMKATVEAGRCLSCHPESHGTTVIENAETPATHDRPTTPDRPCAECHERIGHTKSLASRAP